MNAPRAPTQVGRRLCSTCPGQPFDRGQTHAFIHGKFSVSIAGPVVGNWMMVDVKSHIVFFATAVIPLGLWLSESVWPVAFSARGVGDPASCDAAMWPRLHTRQLVSGARSCTNFRASQFRARLWKRTKGRSAETAIMASTS